MMPMRRRTRSEDRAYRIDLERQHNAARIARKQLLLAERIARDDDPTTVLIATHASDGSRPSSRTLSSRISTLRTLPVTVIGNSSTTWT